MRAPGCALFLWADGYAIGQSVGAGNIDQAKRVVGTNAAFFALLLAERLRVLSIRRLEIGPVAQALTRWRAPAATS